MCRAMALSIAWFALWANLGNAGEVTIDVTTVLDASNQYPLDALRVIDGQAGPTTVSVTSGALVGDGIQVYDTSSVLLVGGELLGALNEGLNAYDSSSVYVLGGEVRTSANDGIAARDASELYVTGGVVTANAGAGLLARNDSRVFLSGGTIRGLGRLSSQAPAAGVQSANAAQVEMSAGALSSEIGPAAFAANVSRWNISGGTLLAGADSPALLLEDDSRAAITGGSFQSAGEFTFELRENAQLELRDGAITGGILAAGASQIHVYGFNLQGAQGQLTGVLEGGAELNTTYQLLDQAQLVLHSLQTTGDTDGDQDVDLADLNNVRNHFGGTGLGDANGDNLVNLQDLNDVRNHFGFVGGAQSVPEPPAFLLVAMSLFAATIWRRSRPGQQSGSASRNGRSA